MVDAMFIDNKKAIWGIWLVFLLLVHTSCTNSISRPERTLNLLPEPAQLTIGKEAFILQDNMIICINDSSLNHSYSSALDNLDTFSNSFLKLHPLLNVHIQKEKDEKSHHTRFYKTLKHSLCQDK